MSGQRLTYNAELGNTLWWLKLLQQLRYTVWISVPVIVSGLQQFYKLIYIHAALGLFEICFITFKFIYNDKHKWEGERKQKGQSLQKLDEPSKQVLLNSKVGNVAMVIATYFYEWPSSLAFSWQRLSPGSSHQWCWP